MSEPTKNPPVEPGDDPKNDNNELTVDQLKDELSKVRKEAAKYRTRSKEYDTFKEKSDKYEQAIKLLTGDDEADPEKLKGKVDQYEGKLSLLQKENKLIRLAHKHKADDELVIAHLKSKGLLADADDKDLDGLVKQAIEEKPNLKLNVAVNVGDTKDENQTGSKTEFNKWIRGKLS